MESNEVDIVENGAVVKVFLLEGALPWNAPADVREAAGPFWDDFGMYRLQLADCHRFFTQDSSSKALRLHTTVSAPPIRFLFYTCITGVQQAFFRECVL